MDSNIDSGGFGLGLGFGHHSSQSVLDLPSYLPSPYASVDCDMYLDELFALKDSPPNQNQDPPPEQESSHQIDSDNQTTETGVNSHAQTTPEPFYQSITSSINGTTEIPVAASNTNELPNIQVSSGQRLQDMYAGVSEPKNIRGLENTISMLEDLGNNEPVIHPTPEHSASAQDKSVKENPEIPEEIEKIVENVKTNVEHMKLLIPSLEKMIREVEQSKKWIQQHIHVSERMIINLKSKQVGRNLSEWIITGRSHEPSTSVGPSFSAGYGHRPLHSSSGREYNNERFHQLSDQNQEQYSYNNLENLSWGAPQAMSTSVHGGMDGWMDGMDGTSPISQDLGNYELVTSSIPEQSARALDKFLEKNPEIPEEIEKMVENIKTLAEKIKKLKTIMKELVGKLPPIEKSSRQCIHNSKGIITNCKSKQNGGNRKSKQVRKNPEPNQRTHKKGRPPYDDAYMIERIFELHHGQFITEDGVKTRTHRIWKKLRLKYNIVKDERALQQSARRWYENKFNC